MIASGLRVGCTVKEIIKFNQIKKSTVYAIKKKFDEFIAAGGVSEEFDFPKKTHRRQSDAKGPILVRQIRDIVDADPERSKR